MSKPSTKILFLLLFSFAALTCYRDQPSSYNIDKIQSIMLNYPRGGESFKSNQTIPVSWTSYNLNSNLRIKLLDSTVQIYSVSNIPDSGNYALQIPSFAVPSHYYKLVIESMRTPEVNDATKDNFTISPAIDGKWLYSNLIDSAGLEISMDLSSWVGDSFLGEGRFYFKYPSHNILMGYESYITINGILSYPQIGFQIKGDDDRIFNLTGQMSAGGEIHGKITGWIDSTYGSIADSLILIRIQ